MTARHRCIDDIFTDVIGKASGHRGRCPAAFSFPLLGVPIAQIEAAAAAAAVTKPVGLAMTSKQYAPHHYPPGGGSGVVTCSVC